MTFWKTFWASLLASIASGLVVTGIFFAILSAMIAGFNGMFESKTLVVEDHTVLHMTLDTEIGDYSYAQFDPASFSLRKQFGVSDILRGLKIAAEDRKIEGIFINCASVPAGMASLKEIRDGLLSFKSSGKFIVAYSENMDNKAYYLSSVADKVYVFPSGMLEFLGLGAELTFVKGALEMLDVEMQVIRGSNNKFKSAVEPLIAEEMSEANREQTTKYVNALWSVMLDEIAKSRNVKVERLNEIADSVFIRKSGDAVKYKMADAVMYYDQVLDELKSKAGTKEGDDLELLSFETYCAKKIRKENNLAKLSDENLAVIFAEGEIVDGYGAVGEIGGTSLSEQIREAREDDDIKAVVLRINSPGGSALASDVIWREVILTKKEKPFVVSMGDVAASGGYYIACAADKIFAQPNTITGSIGVFGIIPYTGDMFKNKLGITFDRVQTNKHSIISLNKRLDEEELAIVQGEVDAIYDDFISKVAKGRGMGKADVDSIGQGRVWAGLDAKEIGLVDEFGGLNDAISFAAEKAGISDSAVSIRYYPEDDNSKLLEFLEAIDEAEEADAMLQSDLERRFMDIWSYVRSLSRSSRIQARMPYLVWVE